MFAMFGVVFLHTLAQRGDLNSIDFNSANYYISWFFEVLFFGAVNIFAMITGYVMWGRRGKISSALYIYLQVFVITLICFAFACYLLPYEVDRNRILEVICPPLFGHPTYWYIAAYLFMYPFIPIMNLVIKKMTHQQHKYLITTIMVMLCILPYFVKMDYFFLLQSYSPFLLIAMYFFGAYAGKYPPRKYVKSYKYLIYALLCVAGTYVLTLGYDFYTLKFLKSTSPSYKFVTYTAPLVVLSSYYFVRFFSTVNICFSVQNFLKRYRMSIFGVYVISCNFFVFNFAVTPFCKNFLPYAGLFEIFIVLIIVCATFFVCLLLDRIRYSLFELFQVKQFCDFVDDKVRNRIKSKG